MDTLWLRRTAVFLLTSLALISFAARDGRGQKIEPGCTLPFDAIKEEQDIDDTCPSEGSAKTAKARAQNHAKNNFCAQGPPVNVTYQTFVRLQAVAEQKKIPFGAPNVYPDDRDDLKNLVTVGGKKIGEGTLVRIVTYILDAHYSNDKKKKKGKSGESVNCYTPGKEFNDIHIELVRSADEDDSCKSLTAEISPHFRPEAWAVLDEEYPSLKRRPVRITGALFFDSVHAPCKGGNRTSPARISLWEIHPVYAIDVCKNKTLAACAASSTSAWESLDKWIGHESHEDEE